MAWFLVREKFRKLEGWSFGEPVLGYGEGSEIKQKLGLDHIGSIYRPLGYYIL